MKSRKFRVGLIGAGGIAQNCHIPGWKNLPEAEIVGIADVSEPAVRKAAELAGGTRTFSDYRDLLKLDLDAVDICTPNMVHTPAALAALNAGLHVLCEKPLAVSTADVRAMGTLADKKKLKLMTAQHQRFTQGGLAAKAWVDGGNLGDAYHARVRAVRRAWLPPSPGFIDKKLAGGGPCMDIGVHALDLCLWLMGFPKPVRVTGTSKTVFAKGHDMPNLWGEWDRERYSVEDFATGFVHFDNGATLLLEAAWMCHQVENEDLLAQIFGKKGGIKWPSAEFATVTNGVHAQGSLLHPQSVPYPHWSEIAAFMDCVVNDKPSPVPWTETIKVIGILEAIYRSSEEGKEVAIKG
ncbi:MAG: Gfo/Idh/MocA family oxidoreductase [Verrucomicrobia bacterium]|nr:Gfo/Idh/MocA family oxidoreductase [Verrucomicrobiota bacterium]